MSWAGERNPLRVQSIDRDWVSQGKKKSTAQVFTLLQHAVNQYINTGGEKMQILGSY
jgi:hypothetical protein